MAAERPTSFSPAMTASSSPSSLQLTLTRPRKCSAGAFPASCGAPRWGRGHTVGGGDHRLVRQLRRAKRGRRSEAAAAASVRSGALRGAFTRPRRARAPRAARQRESQLYGTRPHLRPTYCEHGAEMRCRVPRHRVAAPHSRRHPPACPQHPTRLTGARAGASQGTQGRAPSHHMRLARAEMVCLPSCVARPEIPYGLLATFSGRAPRACRRRISLPSPTYPA